MSIAPIVHEVVVKAPPARAFDLWITRMAEWWPKTSTIGQKPFAAIVTEPRAGGRWFERDAEGNETNWGKVLAFEPPSRLLLGWQINTQWSFDPKLMTEVELTFVAEGGGTRVRLEHRQLERFGADAAAHADAMRGGWPKHLDEFARYADSRS